MFNKKICLSIFTVLLLILPTVSAVTVSCGRPVGSGDYEFENVDSGNARVTISNSNSAVTITPSSQFEIAAGGSQIVNFRTSQSGGLYFRSFVTYKELYGAGISAGLECPFYASSGSGDVTTTTTPETVDCGEDPGYEDGCYNGMYRQYYCNDVASPTRCPADKCIIAAEDCHVPCCIELLGDEGRCVNDECVIPGNNPPTIDTYEPTDTTLQIELDETISFNHTSSDIDGDTLTYKWLENGAEKSTSQNWIYSPSLPGTKNITLVVSDSSSQDSQEWSVTVNNGLSNGESCTEDIECQSGYCVHDVCRSSDPYCGDSHCDSGESCSSCSSDCGSCSSGGDSGGDSGGSSGSGWGSSGGSSSKSTGFYDFESFIQAEAGKETSVEGYFYSKYQSDQTDIEFKIAGIDNNWFTISPSSVEKVSYEEEVPIRITFNAPQDTQSGDYPFKLSTKIGTINYEESITLVVTASQVTTTIPTTTTIESTTNLEGEEENKSPITGFFVRVGDLAKRFWYIPVILVVLFLAWKFLGLSFVKEDTGYIPSEKVVEHKIKPKEEREYLEIKQPEPRVKVKEEPKPQVVKKPDEALERAREKVIKEMRLRAMQEEGKRRR
ncbi:MAG: hypothetical protein ISS48_03335 [Candidatus Aenigmarchaeota archaeon]|nr:hypothetical protein [Candidatus Aenigmarchaeota archaeon]